MKIRVAKKATKGKKVRWRKGESSSLNARSNKFRSKVNLFSCNENYDNDLRIDSLSCRVSNLLKCSSDDCENMSTGTLDSFVSVFTDCSNQSFSKLLNNLNLSSLLHREMIAILATATETIKEKNGKESETEYFAVFMTLLENCEKEETLVAILSLLYLILKNVPSSVLKLKFSETSKVFIKYLSDYHESNNGYLLMNLIRCLAQLLKKQEYAVWQLPSTHQKFDLILTFTLHSKPRVRKSAHRSIVSIIKGSDIVWQGEPRHHLAAPLAAKFCMNKIKETNINDNFNQVLYMLNLLKDIISVLPYSSLKPCCETLLRVCSLKNMLAIHNCFQVFNSLFIQKNTLRDLNYELTASLIRALYDYQPSINNSEPLSLWITVLQQAFFSLYSMKKDLSFKLISELIITLTSCFQSDSKLVHSSVAHSLKRIIEDIIADSLNEIPIESMTNIMETLEGCLSFKYQNAWGSVCSVICVIFEQIGPKKSYLVLNFIKQLANLREGYNSQYFNDIEHTLSFAIKFVGLRNVIEVIPLEINLIQNNFGFSWLLPLLCANIEKTQLSFFVEYFIPLSMKIEQIIQELEEQKSNVESNLYKVLYKQIWSLLPSFCNQPTDLIEVFTPSFAKLLGTQIEKDSEIRFYCLSSLRVLVKKCSAENEKTLLKYYAKNYLSILFKIYINQTSDKLDGNALSVYETIKIFLNIADDELIQLNFNKIMTSLVNYDGDKQLRHLFLDLLRLFIPFLSLNELIQVFNQVINDSIKDNQDFRRQKKGYRLIEEICKTNLCCQFLESINKNIIDFFLDCLVNCAAQAKSSPLRALNLILEKKFSNVVNKVIQNLNRIVNCIVHCLILSSSRVRKASLELLSTTVKSIDNGHNIILNKLTEMFHESEILQKQAILRALAHVMINFKEKFNSNIKYLFLDRILELLQSDHRPFVKIAFSVLKVWLKTISEQELFQSLHLVISTVTSINEVNRSVLRIEIKKLITRLIRKFGYETISKMIPEDYYKVLRSIRKIEARKRKKKSIDSESVANSKISYIKTIDDILENSSSEELEEMSKFSSRSNKPQTWIEEGGDDDIVDLMTQNVIRKIHSQNPYVKNYSREKSPDFETNEDGKLVIKFLDGKGSKRKLETEQMSDNQTDLTKKLRKKKNLRNKKF